MSMIGKLARVTREQLRDLERDPGAIEAFVSGGDGGEVDLADLSSAEDVVARLPPQLRAAFERLPEAQREAMLAPLRAGLAGIAASRAGGPGSGGGKRAQKPKPVGGPRLDLHKDWHALHFLLAGSVEDVPATPPGNALLGGRELGDDLGYGPARAFGPEDVAAVARALSTVDEAVLRGRFDPSAMAAKGVYAVGPGEEWAPIWASFERLRAFYAEAASAGDALVLWLE